MTEPLKLGLVGAGAIAQSYTKALEDSVIARLVGIADTRAEAAAAAAETMNCESYTSHEDLVDKAGCEAVIVCTPPSTHSAIAGYFIDRGIPVLCEKPLSTDTASARALCEAAESEGVILAMASKFRYVEDVIRARSIITSGLLGDIILMENAFASSVNMERRWNSDPKIGGGGVLIDNGTHSVDIVRYLLGPIVDVLAVEGTRIQDIPVEDSANLFVHTESGATAHIDLSWSLNKDLDTFIRVYGTDGTILLGWQESRYKQKSSADWVVFGQGYDKLSAFQGQIRNFCNRVKGIEPLLISNADAIASVEVIQAAYTSLKQGGWVTINGSGTTASMAKSSTAA